MFALEPDWNLTIFIALFVAAFTFWYIISGKEK